MAAPLPAPAPAPFFVPLARFKDYGLPAKTKSYELNGLGLLNLVKDPAGRVGVTADEARRFASSARPLAECKRNLAAATKASLESRRAAATA